MARAFVAGATGLTGRHTVAVLRRLGHDVVAHVRPDSPRLGEWQRRFAELGATVDAAPWEASAIAGAVASAEPDVIFALLGTTQARIKGARARGDDANARGYAEVDVGMTRMLYEGARRATPRPRFVYLSSSGAGTPGKGAYLDARTEVETLLKRGDVPYTIARPAMIVGDRDDARPLERFAAPLATAGLSALRLLGGKKTAAHLTNITGEDLAAALVRLGLDPDWRDRVAEREDLG